MELMTLVAFGLGVLFGLLMTAVFCAHSDHQTRQALEQAESEIVILNKQLKAQNQIYSELEQRLIRTFRQPEESETDEPRETFQIGNSHYFTRRAYEDAVRRGELEKLDGYMV